MKLFSCLFTLLLASCASVDQVLDPEVFYKRDIQIEINGARYEGVATVPKANSYDILLRPKGKADLVLITSCHREYEAEKLKSRFRYEYTPLGGIEDAPACPLQISVYEKKKGRHSWAFITFEHPNLRLPATLKCNGSVISALGVSACQSKAGLIQRIEFKEEVRVWSPVKCQRLGRSRKIFQFEISPRQCQYTFETRDGRLHTMTTLGYEGVPIREN